MQFPLGRNTHFKLQLAACWVWKQQVQTKEAALKIFVDESGSFANTELSGSWCVIAEYVSPECDRKAIEKLIFKLRRRGGNLKPEVKLGELTEIEYFQFLNELGKLNGILFTAATDMSLNKKEAVETHRNIQASRVVEHIEKMLHESMRVSLTTTSEGIRSLPANLYAQLIFQISLFHEVIVKSTLYYAQRIPQTLRDIRWRVDQKDIHITGYEKIFRRILPSILQSMSMEEPLMMLEGADYSHMSQYEYAAGEFPKYLVETYGLPAKDGFNLQKMVAGNFKFVDSKEEIGVQVADLLVSGIRRLLKCNFSNNERAAVLLGGLCVSAYRGGVPLKLFSLGEERGVGSELAAHLHSMQQHAKSMLT
jgi:hypothetical protein